MHLLTRFEPQTWFHALGFDDHDECEDEAGQSLSSHYDDKIPLEFSSLKQMSIFMADNFEDVNSQVKNATPLSVALLRNNAFAVKRLFRRKCLDVNLKFKENSDVTPLLLAIKLNRPELVKILVERGADINAYCDGLTLLHHACKLNLGLNRDKILRYLIISNVVVHYDGPTYELSHSTNWAEEIIQQKLELARTELLNHQQKRFVLFALFILLAVCQFIDFFYFS